MEPRNASTGVVVAVVGLLVLVAAGAGFLWFLSAGPSMTTIGVEGADSLDAGYTLVPGPVEVAADGSRRATLHCQLSTGWFLEAFSPLRQEVRPGGEVREATLVSTIPEAPIRDSFDLVVQYTLPEPAEGEVRVTRLWIDVEARARTGGLFGARSDSHRSVSFVIDEEAGILR